MLRKVLSGIVLLVVLLGASFLTTQAYNEEDIFAAIELGVPWLAEQQEEDAYWIDPWYGEPVASTGFAVLKLLEYAYEKGLDPFDPEYTYNSEVETGLGYLWNAAEESDCAGIVFGNGFHETYSTGVAMMAIAATGNPDFVLSSSNPVIDGKSVLEVVQGAVDHFVCAQNPDGGWRYWFNDDPSDNSNTGYAVLGLRYAEEFGASIPQSLKDRLSVFVDAIQDASGGSEYTVGGGWVNVLKTGNLLFEMAFVGDTIDAPRVQAAINYIATHWNDMNNDPGWRGHNQAMYCLMKGFGAFGIEEIEVGGVPVVWFQDFADDLLSRQQDDGSWLGENWGGSLLATEWALLTLEKIAPPPPNEPPDCSTAVPSVFSIWPPNHKFINVNVLGVTDPEDDPFYIVIDGIYQDEPVDSVGDGKFTPDGSGVGTDTAYVRAERMGGENGRVYHIFFTATDDQGAFCTGEVLVGVPHDKKDTAVDDGPLFDSTALFP